MKVNFIKKDLVVINKDEAFRHMGYNSKTVDKETTKLLNESIAELKDLSELKYVYKIFDIEKENNNISFENMINIKSNDLYKLFKNCEKSAIIAATLGFEVEKRIRYYSLTNLSKALVFDACATSCIEALCDVAQAEINEIALKEGFNITHRYSPGYGDVPISLQGEILSALNAQKLIGLSVLDSFILVPRKSVTAFIGFIKDYKINKKSCIDCNLFGNCSFSKEGERKC
jgi:hypothetical protein